MAESKEHLKRLLMNMKEDSEKVGLKQHSENIQLVGVKFRMKTQVTSSIYHHNISLAAF